MSFNNNQQELVPFIRSASEAIRLNNQSNQQQQSFRLLESNLQQAPIQPVANQIAFYEQTQNDLINQIRLLESANRATATDDSGLKKRILDSLTTMLSNWTPSESDRIVVVRNNAAVMLSQPNQSWPNDYNVNALWEAYNAPYESVYNNLASTASETPVANFMYSPSNQQIKDGIINEFNAAYYLLRVLVGLWNTDWDPDSKHFEFATKIVEREVENIVQVRTTKAGPNVKWVELTYDLLIWLVIDILQKTCDSYITVLGLVKQMSETPLYANANVSNMMRIILPTPPISQNQSTVAGAPIQVYNSYGYVTKFTPLDDTTRILVEQIVPFNQEYAKYFTSEDNNPNPTNMDI